MTNSQKFYATEKRERLFALNNYVCPFTGKRVDQLAHCIPKTKANLKKYGEEIINHDYNLIPVHGLEANAKCLVENNAFKKAVLIGMIKNAIYEGVTKPLKAKEILHWIEVI